MHPWQQIGLEDEAPVRAMNSYRQGGPVFRLTHQGSVPLTPSSPIVYWPDFGHPVHPVHPNVSMERRNSGTAHTHPHSVHRLPRKLKTPSQSVAVVSMPDTAMYTMCVWLQLLSISTVPLMLHFRGSVCADMGGIWRTAASFCTLPLSMPHGQACIIAAGDSVCAHQALLH